MFASSAVPTSLPTCTQRMDVTGVDQIMGQGVGSEDPMQAVVGYVIPPTGARGKNVRNYHGRRCRRRQWPLGETWTVHQRQVWGSHRPRLENLIPICVERTEELDPVPTESSAIASTDVGTAGISATTCSSATKPASRDSSHLLATPSKKTKSSP